MGGTACFSFGRTVFPCDLSYGRTCFGVHRYAKWRERSKAAQGFKEDAHSEIMGTIKLEDIVFSPQVQSEWSDSALWDKLLNRIHIKNPKKV